MGYFSKGFTRDKLCALYFLDKFREDISLHTLCRLMHDNEWAPYLELHACMIGLERAGMVAAVPRDSPILQNNSKRPGNYRCV